jgi:hypothetical protein
MTTTTINDLFTRYSDGCGSEGPALDRDALQDDFRDWCRARGVEARHEVQGEAYLVADDGPYSDAATSDDARPVLDWVDAEPLAKTVEVRVTSVTAEESDDVDEGAAYWVEAHVNGLGHEVHGVRLYAAPTQPTGRLAPCGDSLDCWMDPELSRIYGESLARVIGQEAIARARV